MEQGKHRQYTAEDIVRYHQGLLTPQEMHEMERAALEDPFLADAMEGYVHASDPLEAVAELRGELNRRTGKRPMVVPLRRRSILQVAALVLVLAGLGWIAYQYNAGNNNLALNPEKSAQDEMETVVPQAAAADSIQNNYTAPSAQDQARVVPPITSRERNALTRTEPVTANEEPPAGVIANADVTAEQAQKEEIMAKSVRQAAPAAAGSAGQANAPSVAATNYISGKVVDNNNMAVPNAQVNVLQQKTSFRA